MFDLNQAVAAWRTRLAAANTCGRADVDELEAHLRDEMDRLRSGGLSEQEAFWVAAHRLGSVSALSEEYAKVNPMRVWLGRLGWVAAGVLAWHVIGAAAGIASWASLYVGHLVGLTGYPLGALGVGAQFLVLGAAALGAAVLWWLLFAHRAAGPAAPASSARGWLVAIAGGVVIVLLTFGSMVAPMLLLRSLPVEEVGQVAMVRSVANVAWSVGFPLLLVAMIFWLRRTAHHDAAPLPQ